jgi:thiol:disulfide interchange protein
LNTQETQRFLAENNIEVLVADLTESAPEIDELMVTLGNTGKAIPFYAIYPADGAEPITFSDVPLRQQTLLGYLKQAITNNAEDPQSLGQRTPSTVESLRGAGMPAPSQR